MVIHDYLRRAASEYPEKTAVVSGKRRTTYAELYAKSGAFAAYLLTLNLRRGDRVAVFLDNCLEVVIAIFAISESGGCMTIINPATQVDRLSQILENSSPQVVLTSRDKLPHVERARGSSTTPWHVLLIDPEAQTPGAKSFPDILAQNRKVKTPQVLDVDLAAIIYTSGSTGRPKGVTHLHRSIHATVVSVAEYLDHTADDVVLNVLPLSSSYGMLQVLVTVYTAGTVVLERGVGFPYEIVRRIETEKVTGFAGAPTIWAILLKLDGVSPEQLGSLRYITNAAAALPASFVPRLRRLLPTAKVYLMHGLTECLRTTYLPPDEVESRSTSVGKGMRNVELWVEDADGRKLPAGHIGELIVRGPTLMVGYWNDPEGTAKALIPGPYPWERVLRTRDLFTCDEDGYFYFVARSDELIKSKGEKVSPIEVEDIIYTLPQVLEVRVVGVPHEIFGQAIRAEIVVKEGDKLGLQDVKAHCRKLLEDFKIPHEVLFVPSLPKTQGGKIKRDAASIQH